MALMRVHRNLSLANIYMMTMVEYWAWVDEAEAIVAERERESAKSE